MPFRVTPPWQTSHIVSLFAYAFSLTCGAKQHTFRSVDLPRAGIERAVEVKTGISRALWDLAGCLYYDGFLVFKIDISNVLL